MFAIIAAGRPVQTQLQTISPTQFAFSIPSQPAFSHLVVFLLPGNALPPGTAAAVYIQLPPAADFKLLGAVANDKQSAIFKVRGSGAAGAGGAEGDDAMVDDAPAGGVGSGAGQGQDIVLGISIEPAANVQAQLAAMRPQAAAGGSGMALVRHQPQAAQPERTLQTARRIIQNAFNFLSGFSGGPGGDMVPLKSFQDWWAKFEKKIQLDPSFLERDEGN